MIKRTITILSMAFAMAMSLPLAVYGTQMLQSDSIKTLIFHFQFDKSTFLRDFKGNATGLNTIAAIAADGEAMSLLRSVTVTGAASPMMDAVHNSRLSYERAREVGGFIGWKYPQFKAMGISLASIGEDWEGLDELVEQSAAVPMRDEVLRILRSESDKSKVSARIKALDGGKVYTWLEKKVLPELRQATVVMTFSVPQQVVTAVTPVVAAPVVTVPEPQPVAKEVAQEPTKPETPPVETVAPVSVKKQGYRFAIKVNLLELGGIMPDFSGLRGGVNYYGITPNLEGEWFATPSWSLALSGSWAKFQTSNSDLTRRWAYSNISLEPRLWLNANNANTGFFAGIYGAVGQYNMLFKDKLQASSGDFYSTGLSVGYASMLTGRLMIEAGIHGGYTWADNFNYTMTPAGPDMKVHEGTVQGFRLQSLRLMIGYRFGKSGKNR